MKHQKTLWGLVLVIGGLLLGSLLIAQPFQDPLFHPFRPGDPSAGLYWGTVFPSLASTGTTPPDGALFIRRFPAATADPSMWMLNTLLAIRRPHFLFAHKENAVSALLKAAFGPFPYRC